ncbi:MarR family winged helix-turn-helix transcriptional regulator [Paraburkholderia sp. BCC1884]|uniref:MarR family winged helix-turn-helix transcriptional regulator n=1 Tax=Paraburkholderia sp. BCC1884 TaxID=2562668 RepID=UPI00118284EF|nr:MarR family transcriptional regulator [Paraburkholderia sp. BCC1884]
MKKANTPTLTDLDGPDLCFCLAGRRSARYVARIYESFLEPAGITSSQFSILSILDYYPGMTVAELADKMEMDRTTIVRALKPLKDQGFVVEGDEKRGRAAILQVGPSGMDKLDESRPYWDAAQLAFEEKVGKGIAARFREMAISVISR